MKVKRSRKLKSHYFIIDVGYKGMAVRLFFSQYANQSSWSLLLTDNLSLTYDEAIRTYQIRWGVEVFFYGKYIVMQSRRESHTDL